MMRTLLMAAVLALSAAVRARQDAPRPLRSVLVDCGCLMPSMPDALLSTMVDDFDCLNDDAGFVVAYWRAPHDFNRDNEPWHVMTGNTKDGCVSPGPDGR